jgi:hypothetical protein
MSWPGADLGDHHASVASGAVCLFVVLVTVTGWAFPTRDLTAILAGVIGILGQPTALWLLVMLNSFPFIPGSPVGPLAGFAGDDPVYGGGWSSEEPDLPDGPIVGMPVPGSPLVNDDQSCIVISEAFEEPSADDCADGGFWDAEDPFTAPSEPDGVPWWDDVSVILGFALVQCQVWAFCHRRTGHAGYRVLILASLLTMVPTSLGALDVDDPAYGTAALGALGAIVLGYAALRAKTDDDATPA